MHKYVLLMVLLFLFTSFLYMENDYKNNDKKFGSMDTVINGSKITIPINPEIGDDLAIINPEGIYYFLSYSEKIPQISNTFYPVIKKNDLLKIKNLVIDTDSLTGSPWVYGKDKNEKVFTVEGVYTIILDQNLQSFGNVRFSHKIYFIPN